MERSDKLAAVGSAISPFFAQTFFGLSQKSKGKRILRDLKLPEYEIPDEVGQNISDASAIAAMGMPTAEYERGRQNIQRSEAFAMNQLRGRGQAIAGAGNIAQRSMDAQTGLDVASARMRLTGTQMLMGARQSMAQQRLAKQQWEKFNPYLAKVQEGQAMIGAGTQNIAGGISNALSMAMMAVNPAGGMGMMGAK